MVWQKITEGHPPTKAPSLPKSKILFLSHFPGSHTFSGGSLPCGALGILLEDGVQNALELGLGHAAHSGVQFGAEAQLSTAPLQSFGHKIRTSGSEKKKRGGPSGNICRGIRNGYLCWTRAPRGLCAGGTPNIPLGFIFFFGGGASYLEGMLLKRFFLGGASYLEGMLLKRETIFFDNVGLQIIFLSGEKNNQRNI